MVNENEASSINDPVKVIDAKYDASGTISCKIKLTLDQEDYWSVTASPLDSAEHGVRLFNELKSGKWGDVAAYTEEDQKQDRIIQDSLLQSDLIGKANLVISPLSDERDAGIISDDDLERWKAWVAYRKSLRELDVTAEEIEWPSKPD